MVYLLKIYGIGLRVLDSGKHGNLKQWSVASEFLSPSLITRLLEGISIGISYRGHSLDPSLSTRLRGSLSGFYRGR